MDKDAKKIRILLVDDHPEVLKQVRARLEYEQDFHICSTATNETFLKRANICKPALILIDPCTKGRFNYDGIRAVKESLPNTEVIVLTAIADISSQLELKKLGVKHIMEKGVASEILVKIVRRSISINK